MHKFVRNFITEWRRLGLPFAGETVVVAVSGGADSVSLLLALHDLRKRKKLGHRIVAAHFNHRLRGVGSDADEEYVRHLATTLGVELAVGHASDLTNGNLEQNARNARYNFLAHTAENLHAFAVVTGHTINDQAETFLMNLIRGSGPDGLTGMKPIRNLITDCGLRIVDSRIDLTVMEVPREEEKSAVRNPQSAIALVRPLLNWAKRPDTEGFCHECGIEYRYDTMNEDTSYRRVRIRKILLPLLEDFNPKIIDTLAQTAGLMANFAVQADPAVETQQSCHLLLKDLKLLDSNERQNTVRTWLRQCRGTARGLELKHIEAVGRLVFSTKSGRAAELPGGARVIKTGGKLVYEQK